MAAKVRERFQQFQVSRIEAFGPDALISSITPRQVVRTLRARTIDCVSVFVFFVDLPEKSRVLCRVRQTTVSPCCATPRNSLPHP